MIITFRLSNEQAWLFRHYATEKGITVSELVRQSVKERIESDGKANAKIVNILNAK